MSAETRYIAGELLRTESRAHDASEEAKDGKDGKVIGKGDWQAEQREGAESRKVDWPTTEELAKRRED